MAGVPSGAVVPLEDAFPVHCHIPVAAVKGNRPYVVNAVSSNSTDAESLALLDPGMVVAVVVAVPEEVGVHPQCYFAVVVGDPDFAQAQVAAAAVVVDWVFLIPDSVVVLSSCLVRAEAVVAAAAAGAVAVAAGAADDREDTGHVEAAAWAFLH